MPCVEMFWLIHNSILLHLHKICNITLCYLLIDLVYFSFFFSLQTKLVQAKKEVEKYAINDKQVWDFFSLNKIKPSAYRYCFEAAVYISVHIGYSSGSRAI